MFYLVGENDLRREAFCEALADALANKQALCPRGLIAKDVAADIARERSEAEMRSALGRPTRLLASSGTEWTIVVEDDCRLRPAPLHRFIRVMPARGFGDLLEALSPIAPVLAGVALDGFDSNRESVCDKLMQLGAQFAGVLTTAAIPWTATRFGWASINRLAGGTGSPGSNTSATPGRVCSRVRSPGWHSITTRAPVLARRGA